jgi:hypothetical protein
MHYLACQFFGHIVAIGCWIFHGIFESLWPVLSRQTICIAMFSNGLVVAEKPLLQIQPIERLLIASIKVILIFDYSRTHRGVASSVVKRNVRQTDLKHGGRLLD